MKFNFAVRLKCDRCGLKIIEDCGTHKLTLRNMRRFAPTAATTIDRMRLQALDDGWTLYSRVSDHQELSYCPTCTMGRSLLK